MADIDIAQCAERLLENAVTILQTVQAAPAGTTVVVRVGAEVLAVHAVAAHWAYRVANDPGDCVLHIQPNPHSTLQSLRVAIETWARDERTRPRIHVRLAPHTSRITIHVPAARRPLPAVPRSAPGSGWPGSRGSRRLLGAWARLAGQVRACGPRGRTVRAAAEPPPAQDGSDGSQSVVVTVARLLDGEHTVEVCLDDGRSVTHADAVTLVRALAGVQAARRAQRDAARTIYPRQLEQAAHALQSTLLLLLPHVGEDAASPARHGVDAG